MKNLLILAGAGFIAWHFLNKSQGGTNPTVDGNATLTMSSVANSVPMPGTATVDTANQPVAAAPINLPARATTQPVRGRVGASGVNFGENPNTGIASPQSPSPSAVRLNAAFDHFDYRSPLRQMDA